MHLGIVEPDTSRRRIEVLREMLLALGQDNAETIKLVRQPNGKQKLEFDDGLKWHCNFSRVRNAPQAFGLVAISGKTELGIDVETWPKTETNPDFLESISTSEDMRAIQSLSGFAQDASLALWVIKEAALKCAGEVMIDPRHLAVSVFRDGVYRTSPSLLAGAPVPDIIVALFHLSALKWPDTEFLCGIAMPSSENIIREGLLNPVLTGTGWQIAALNTRMHSK